MHHRVADEGEIHDLARVDHRFRGELTDDGGDRLTYGKGHLLLAARVHHHIADPAHQIFTKADLRVHEAGRCHHLAGAKLDQMAGDRGRADIEGDTVDLLFQPWPDGDDALVGMHDSGDAPVGFTECLLQILHDPKVGAEAGELPLLFKGALQSREITGLRMHVRRFDLDIVERDHRIELDVPDLGTLAHELAVHLALGGHVDDQIALKRRLAAEPPAGLQALSLIKPCFNLARRGGVSSGRGDAVFREFPFAERDLAAPAKAASTADRIEVDAKLLGGLQHRRAQRKTATLAGWCEDDQGAVVAQSQASPLIDRLEFRHSPMVRWCMAIP